jgi:hypothetical protein
MILATGINPLLTIINEVVLNIYHRSIAKENLGEQKGFQKILMTQITFLFLTL